MRLDHDGASKSAPDLTEPARGRRRTQAERTALSEDRLLAAALQLISERGYERTTLQAIGERAGYSRKHKQNTEKQSCARHDFSHGYLTKRMMNG